MLVTWHNLNFCVPLTKEDKQALNHRNVGIDELSEPLKQPNLSSHLNVKMQKGKQMKQILTSANGYAKPGEMMAIMGASGSGKTSLLNVIAQRLALSPGCVLEG